MRHPLDVIVPAAVIALASTAFDTITAITAIGAGGDLLSGDLSPWVHQAAGGATFGWLGIVLAIAALRGDSTVMRLLATLAWLTSAVLTWSTPTALAYTASALVGLLSSRDASVRRAQPRLRWSERNASVRAGVIATLLSGPLSVVLGPVTLILTTSGAILMAIGSLAERDGLHGGAGAAPTAATADDLRRARLRRHRVHAGNLCLGAGLIGAANLVFWFAGSTSSGIDPTALVLIGGLFVVAVPMLVIGLILGASTAAESRRLGRRVPDSA